MRRWIVCLGFFLAACAGAAPLPPKAIELNDQGTLALAEGDLETASARFEVALEYNPHFVEALTNLGLVELQRGNFTRARTLLARARRLNPDVAQPHHGLGVLEERRGRPDRASKHYQEALAVDPGFAPARANLARLYFNAGQFERARSQFKRLTEVAPEEPQGFTGLCESLLSLGRNTEADAISQRALRRFGPEPELLILEARRSLRKGRPAHAIELLLPLSTGEDDYAAAALSWIATAELARNRPAHAVGAAKRSLELAPDGAVAIYCLALGLHALDDPAAVAWLERAERLEPGRPLIRAALAEEHARSQATRH
ncbi:MAG: tetratricopeptide repeat protein [Myxococcales bacterium]|nr:tetratricopeptide repeat protein [Myxococcales bacterium]